MKRLILQMQISVDGFVPADDSALDWTLWDWGPSCPWDDCCGALNLHAGATAAIH